MIIIYALYTIYNGIIFFTTLIVLFPWMVLPIMINKKWDKFSFRIVKLWAELWSLLTFVRYHVDGKEHLEKDKAYIFAINHTSFYDTPSLPFVMTPNWRPLVKRELYKFPLFGLVLRVISVAVNRTDHKSRHESKLRLKQTIMDGISIMIFPEGTMNRTKEVLQPFHRGAFQLAVDTDNPVVPVVIKNANKLMPPGSKILKPGKVYIRILPPVYATGEDRVHIDEMKENVHAQMVSELHKKWGFEK